jgi:diguanylate cyclase (GGDEF)-like protein
LFLHLDSELARCRRQGLPLTVLVCDLDGFKQVNDRFGHLEGNRLLHAVARALKGCCREYDYVARMGGDEFVLVLPGLDADAAGHKSEQIHRAVRDAGLPACGHVVSISIGQAHYPEDGVDAEDLLAHADRRMYQAKRKPSLQAASGASPEWLAGVPVTMVQ